MKRIAPLVVCLIAAFLMFACASIRTRVAWASYGDTPLICCGGPGTYIQHFEAPTFQQASLEYTQIVNLPGGCDSLDASTQTAADAFAIESVLHAWQTCPDRCRDYWSSDVAGLLAALKSEVIKAGPSPRSSGGPPCIFLATVQLPPHH